MDYKVIITDAANNIVYVDSIYHDSQDFESIAR